MRPHGSAAELERRRRRAVTLLEQGLGVCQVAAMVGVAPISVSRWRNAHAWGGEKALAGKPVPGRPAKLSPVQRRKLIQLLKRGPRAHGYPNELWTLKRVAQVIQKHFGVTYDPSGVWHVLRAMGWSCQKPDPRGRRARERNEEAIATWRARDWSRIKKSAKKR